MKTAFVGFIGLAALAVAFALGTFLDATVGEVGRHEQSLVDRVGSNVVFQGDTLMVVDYSLFKETFTLENGIVLNHKVVMNLDTIAR